MASSSNSLMRSSQTFQGSLVAPHGGELVNLLREGPELESVMKQASEAPSYRLKPRQQCDLELIMNGGFSPLRGFMNEEDYNGVVKEMRLSSGVLFPMPITLDLEEADANRFSVGDKVALRDRDNRLLALLTIESKWVPNKAVEAENVFGSPDDECHPSIKYLFREAGSVYVGGRIDGVSLPVYYDFPELRRTPSELRALLKRMCWTKIVGFQTRNPMHRSHREVTVRAARQAKANVLVHPVVGMTKPGDVDHFTRVRCYKELMKTYAPGMAMLSLLPLAMRMAGPREALWHAIIRQNYGCTHFCIGRDHAGPGKNRNGVDFYGTYDAQELARKHQSELNIQCMYFAAMHYVEERGEYCTAEEAAGMTTRSISGTELRRRLYRGIPIPDWFSYPNVVRILQSTYPPRHKRGFTIFFTGLSGAGKSTTANALLTSLLEDGQRPVTMLDGDEIRTHLTAELSFSKEDRDKNVRRVGYVASVITKSRGIALIACIAPYEKVREEVRAMVEPHGGFILVHVGTPLNVCESRDPKGLYKRARAGEIKAFTGISDPYESPQKPDIFIDTSRCSVRQAVHEILLHLEAEGWMVAAAGQ